MYNPDHISKTISNSILNNSEWIKSWRLDNSERSFQEAQSENTKKGTRSSGRIVIWLDDDGKLIILDGRHLLEAYRVLGKDIPSDIITFESNSSYDLFIKTIQS